MGKTNSRAKAVYPQINADGLRLGKNLYQQRPGQNLSADYADSRRIESKEKIKVTHI